MITYNETKECYLCGDRFSTKSLIYDDILLAHVCLACFEEMENENNPSLFYCEDCGGFFPIQKERDISNNNRIPYDFICDDCLDDWENSFYEEETLESMNRNKKI